MLMNGLRWDNVGMSSQAFSSLISGCAGYMQRWFEEKTRRKPGGRLSGLSNMDSISLACLPHSSHSRQPPHCQHLRLGPVSMTKSGGSGPIPPSPHSRGRQQKITLKSAFLGPIGVFWAKPPFAKPPFGFPQHLHLR